jgi:N-acetylmuramoyl-L-alanine amidase
MRPRHLIFALWVLNLALALPTWAEDLRVEYEDGRRTAYLALSRLEDDSVEWFVSADALGRALDLERFWRPELRKLVFKVGERRIQVSVDTRLVLDEDRDVLLHVPVRYRGGSVMLPLEFVETVLDPASDGGIRLRRDELSVAVGRRETDIVRIEYDTRSGDTEVRIHMARAFRHRVQATSHELLRVHIFDAQIDPVSVAAERPAPLIRLLRAEQSGREAVLYLELDRRIDGYESRTRNGGRTIVLVLQRPLEPMPLPEFKLPETVQSPTTVDQKRCSIVVLDAGHGGADGGVQGFGRSEKAVTLELAQRMKRILERKLDLRVELLRSSDRALTDDRRAELANKMGGTVMISLHCNGWFDPSASGFEVLFVGPQTMMQSCNMMQRANSSELEDFRPWNTAQLPFAGRSQVLAQLLQIEMGRRLQIPNRGAKESDIDFLKGIAMPAVMVEVGFLTNPEEADTISGQAFADDPAEAVAIAVERYCEQFEAGELDLDRIGSAGAAPEPRGARR